MVDWQVERVHERDGQVPGELGCGCASGKNQGHYETGEELFILDSFRERVSSLVN